MQAVSLHRHRPAAEQTIGRWLKQKERYCLSMIVLILMTLFTWGNSRLTLWVNQRRVQVGMPTARDMSRRGIRLGNKCRGRHDSVLAGTAGGNPFQISKIVLLQRIGNFPLFMPMTPRHYPDKV
jgi:hypothetical protein